jgi:hypothetical protein
LTASLQDVGLALVARMVNHADLPEFSTGNVSMVTEEDPSLLAHEIEAQVIIGEGSRPQDANLVPIVQANVSVTVFVRIARDERGRAYSAALDDAGMAGLLDRVEATLRGSYLGSTLLTPLLAVSHSRPSMSPPEVAPGLIRGSVNFTGQFVADRPAQTRDNGITLEVD